MLPMMMMPVQFMRMMAVLTLVVAATLLSAVEEVEEVEAVEAVEAVSAVPADGTVDQLMTAVVPGLPNLHQVSPVLWRGAQPTAEGMRALEAMGIRTVVNLRGFHSDADEVAGTRLKVVRIPFHTWHAEDEDVALFLRTVQDPANQPVFVHCLHGSDRTGTMSAIYRMVVQGWTAEAALTEMTGPDYGYHTIWINLPPYIRGLDVPAMRVAAGLGPSAPLPPR